MHGYTTNLKAQGDLRLGRNTLSRRLEEDKRNEKMREVLIGVGISVAAAGMLFGGRIVSDGQKLAGKNRQNITTALSGGMDIHMGANGKWSAIEEKDETFGDHKTTLIVSCNAYDSAYTAKEICREGYQNVDAAVFMTSDTQAVEYMLGEIKASEVWLPDLKEFSELSFALADSGTNIHLGNDLHIGNYVDITMQESAGKYSAYVSYGNTGILFSDNADNFYENAGKDIDFVIAADVADAGYYSAKNIPVLDGTSRLHSDGLQFTDMDGKAILAEHNETLDNDYEIEL